MKYKLSDNTEIVVDSDVVSARIKKAIEKSELSYYQLEELTGIPKSAIQRYATGQVKKIPDGRIFSIARATHTSPFYILGVSENINEEPNMGGRIISTPPVMPDIAIYKDGQLKVVMEIKEKMSDEQLQRWLSYGEFLLSQKDDH